MGKVIEQKTGYGVKRENFPNHFIYFCTNDEWYAPMFCGVGTSHSIKIWRTIEGAQKFADRVDGTVIKVE
jgi:hypothetical protein